LLQGYTLSPSKLNRDADGKRKLLLIFIHGFLGDETSFQSFPTHVHNSLSTLLAPTHAVHTKIYPRYRCKGKMDDAARAFSDWLAPHNVHNTDVVLLGHSLGGILAAEVALMTSDSPSQLSPLRHNIIGTLSLDAPLLGMHPGIVTSGIASLFRRDPSPPPPTTTSDTAPTALARPSPPTVASNSVQPQPPSLSAPSEQDFSQTYNQPFDNDVRLPVRSGWSGAWHFISKHSDNLSRATQRLLSAHFEFGACLADFDGLKSRYCRVRLLEEPDERIRATVLHNSRPPPRVRFINYYTASTGRIKATKNLEKTAIKAIPAADVASKENPGSKGPAQDLSTTTTNSLYSAGDLDELDPLAHAFDDDQSTPSTTDSLESDDSDFFLTPTSTDSELAFADDVPGPTSPSVSTVSHLSLTPAGNTTTAIGRTPASALLPVMSIPKMPLLRDFSERSKYKLALREYTADVKQLQRVTTMNCKTDQAHAKHERELAGSMHKAVSHASSTRTTISTATTTTAADNGSGSGSGLLVSLDTRALKASCKRERAAAKASAKSDSRAIKAAAKEMRHALKREAKQAPTRDARYALREASRQARQDAKLERRHVRAAAKTERRAAKTAYKEQRRAARHGDRADSTNLRRDSAAVTVVADELVDDEGQTLGIVSGAQTPTIAEPQAKERRFCILPPLDASGARDPCWVRVRMDGVDEVGAHCGLFAVQDPGGKAATGTGTGWCERYAWLVQDVATRVQVWASESVALDRR